MNKLQAERRSDQEKIWTDYAEAQRLLKTKSLNKLQAERRSDQEKTWTDYAEAQCWLKNIS